MERVILNLAYESQKARRSLLPALMWSALL
nr:MAG TPA: hypothetical protein [Caudoviricetes sp.]